MSVILILPVQQIDQVSSKNTVFNPSIMKEALRE